MKISKRMRIVLDVALSVMIVFEMLIQFTGDFLHEVIGFVFFATVVVHLVFSATWVKKTARSAKEGKMTARRTALAVIGSLLALMTVLLGVSSVAVSSILSSAGFVWPFGSYALWVAVHTFSAYALCALVVVHLAMHWAFLASVLKVPYNPARRRVIGTGVNTVAAIGVLALGVTAVGKMSLQSASGSSEQNSSNAAGSNNTGDSTGRTSDASSLGANSGKSGMQRGKTPGTSSSDASSDSAGSGSASGSGSSSSSGGSSSSSQICTLCHKECLLSAPKCDKPYKAGLL